MPEQRIMLSFRTGGERFNHRVAGAVLRQGHFLVRREDDDDYVLRPGWIRGRPYVLPDEPEHLVMDER